MNFKTKIISIILLLYVSSSNGQSIISFENSNKIIFTSPTLINNKIQTYKGDYSQLLMKNSGTTTEAGFPKLPVFSKFIEIPKNQDVHFEIVAIETESIKNIVPLPYQQPPKRNCKKQKDSFTFNQDFYNGYNCFPEKAFSVSEAKYLGKTKVVELIINPVRFYPKNNSIEIIKKLEISIILKSNLALKSEKAIEEKNPFFNNFILNDFKTEKRSDSINIPEMLIITHDKFYNSILPFVEWKMRKGIKTTIIKTSEIGNNPDAEDIKSVIKTYSLDSTGLTNIEYLLLVGDVDYIPPFYGVRSALNDHDYSTIIGNDFLPDIFVGRFSVNTTDECETYVQKVIQYERYPMNDTDWYDKATIAASNAHLDDNHGKHLVSFFKNQDFSYVDDLRATEGKFTNHDIFTALSDGRSWMFYIGHGDANSWYTQGHFTNYTIENEVGNLYKLPVIVSVACSNADLTNLMSFSEKWLSVSYKRGAIAFIGATEDTPFYLSDTLGKKALMSYVSNKTQTLGEALVYGKLKMNEAFPENTASETEETMQHFLLLGDPTIMPWTKVPKNLNVSFPESIKFHQQFTVNVSDFNGNKINNAVVCITNDSITIQEIALTDSLGNANFDITFKDSGNVKIIVTGRNLLAFESIINVTAIKKISVIENTINIFPNPANSSVIVANPTKQISEIKIISLEGKTLNYYQKIKSNKFNLNIKNINSGIYIVEVKMVDNSVFRKRLSVF